MTDEHDQDYQTTRPIVLRLSRNEAFIVRHGLYLAWLDSVRERPGNDFLMRRFRRDKAVRMAQLRDRLDTLMSEVVVNGA